MGWFRRKRNPEKENPSGFWKEDFSDCVTADFLPGYSVCRNKNNSFCRYVAHFSGMMLCSNPRHKHFIPDGAEPFNPHEGRFSD